MWQVSEQEGDEGGPRLPALLRGQPHRGQVLARDLARHRQQRQPGVSHPGDQARRAQRGVGEPQSDGSWPTRSNRRLPQETGRLCPEWQRPAPGFGGPCQLWSESGQVVQEQRAAHVRPELSVGGRSTQSLVYSEVILPN